jgi:hypothetical protein
MLGFSIDSEARREEEERVEDFVRINLKVRVPKLGSINLGMRLVAKGSGEALLDWIYQKNRGSELLTAGAGRGSLPDNGSDHRPEFTLKDNAYEMRWSQVYAKNVLTQLIDLTIDFKSIDTNSFSRDLLAMKIEDPENEWERTE